jgi:hypothetical protein
VRRDADWVGSGNNLRVIQRGYQSRATLAAEHALGFFRSGRIGVIVFSVNSCCRPRMTITKPALWPGLEISGLHNFAAIN